MIRGTTPTHTFVLPFDSNLVQKIKITYSQLDNVILTKYDADIIRDGNSISLKLTQEETFKFDCHNGLVSIQIRALTTGGEALGSKPILVSVEKCLDDEVLQ